MGVFQRLFHIKGLKRRRNLRLVNKKYAGTKPKYFEKKRKLLNAIGYKIGEGTKIVGPVEWHADVTIGKNCWIGTHFRVHGNGAVEIGDNCDVAPEVALLTGGHAIGDDSRRAGEGESYRITIGSGTWIGARSTVLGNTSVGKGCVIAACACVVKDIPDNTVAGGVPAKVIRRLDEQIEGIITE